MHAGESPLRYGAYRLFLERAAAINPAFAVPARQTRALGEILQRADGLPLAIELIASRANVLTIEGMRTRLAAAMRTARRSAPGGRAQTIDDAIAWSYELLTHDQRMLFAWLSAFSGRFTIEEVERVCDSIPHAVDTLLELVDASLVAIVPGESDAQYRLLETTRAFASTRLSEDGSEHAAFLAHAKHVAQKADALASLSTLQYDLSAAEIAAQMPDYLAALERCAAYGWIALGARILEGVHRYGLRWSCSNPVKPMQRLEHASIASSACSRRCAGCCRWRASMCRKHAIFTARPAMNLACATRSAALP
jgi:non-specific serine/threonine protein kinase